MQKRNKKGITLIALIITIIVMLILVIVIINFTGKGEIFNYAKKATLDTMEAKTMEELDAVKISWNFEKRINSVAEIESFLENVKTNGEIDDYHMVEEGEYIIEKNGYETNIYGGEIITFYVYHSSDNTVEKFTRSDDVTFNIAEQVKDGFLYAGYYSDYAGKGSYAEDGVEKIDGTEIAYNGTNVTWDISKAYLENGTAMYPKDGTTYYIKELSKDKFLRHYRRWGTKGGVVTTIYIYSAIDDGNYNDVGIFLNSKTNRIKYNYFNSSFTINTNNSSNTYTAESCFGVTGRRIFVS